MNMYFLVFCRIKLASIKITLTYDEKYTILCSVDLAVWVKVSTLKDSKMRGILLLSLAISLTLAIDDNVLLATNNDFGGFKVLRVIPTEEQVDFLRLLENNKVELVGSLQNSFTKIYAVL